MFLSGTMTLEQAKIRVLPVTWFEVIAQDVTRSANAGRAHTRRKEGLPLRWQLDVSQRSYHR